MKKIKVSAVSYLNTKPFLYGIFKNKMEEEIDLQLDIPSACAKKLQNGAVDLGLVPVAVIPELEKPLIISDYCIGTVGAVKTVAIFSQCPIQEMTHIYLDYHSRTSVELAKILLQEYWKTAPVVLSAEPGFEEKIEFTRGALIIGDRTIGLEKKHPYIYDLGEAWMDFTGLPFVFAAWVSNRTLPRDFIQRFNAALKRGLDEIPQLTLLLPQPNPDFDLRHYFQHHISYHLDEPKKKALRLFLEIISGKSPSNTAQSLATMNE